MDDRLGPRSILELRDAAAGLHGWVVVDNVAAGPAIGGVRLAPDVGVDEVRRLARAMTLKNAAAGLPHGGAKAAIVADPRLPPSRKEELVRAFARIIGELRSFIPGPDLGTDETAMAFIHDEIGRAVGLPRVLGGLALDAIGATAVGLVAAAEVAAPACKLRLEGARVAVQGFGAVGRHAARLFAARGARVVAVCDSAGGVINGDGLDVAALLAHKRARRPVRDFAGGRATDDRELVAVDCDIFVPAARPDVLRRDNADALRARLVVQGANLPVTDEAERRLYARGVLSLPDFVVNAGGVLCAAVEYRGGSEREALALVQERVAANTRALLDGSGRDGVTPRDAALAMARARVEEAMRYRRRPAAAPPRHAKGAHPHAHTGADVAAEPMHSFADEPE